MSYENGEHLRPEATAALARDLYDAFRPHSVMDWPPFDELSELAQGTWHRMANVAYGWSERQLTYGMNGDPR